MGWPLHGINLADPTNGIPLRVSKDGSTYLDFTVDLRARLNLSKPVQFDDYIWSKQSLRALDKESPPVLCFTFDDVGDYANFTDWVSLFSAQGEVATAYMITNNLGGAANWLALETSGWEIGSHGTDHTDLTGLTEAQIETQLSDSKAALEAVGLTADTLSYPYGNYNDTVRKVARKYYRAARAGYEARNDTPIQSDALNVYTADAETAPTLQGYIDALDAKGSGILIFLFHGYTAGKGTVVNTVIDYAQGLGITIATVRDALDLTGNVVDSDAISIGPQGGLRFARGDLPIHIGEHINGAPGRILDHGSNIGLSIWLGAKGEFRTTGTRNIAIGGAANVAVTTGNNNVAIGYKALNANQTGHASVAIGYEAMLKSTGVGDCIAIGMSALYNQVNGNNNIALGLNAGYSITSGFSNVAIGREAGYTLTTGTYNVFIGREAGKNASQKVDATRSIALGYQSYTDKSDQIVLGDANTVEVLVRATTGVLKLESGILQVKETTTPTPVTDYGKLYTKADNNLYFQDGAGTEHQVAYV